MVLCAFQHKSKMPTIKPKQISQTKLARFFELKEAVAELSKLREELIKLAVEEKLPCQPGRFNLKIDKKAGQLRPKWKEEAEKLAKELGKNAEEFVDAVMANTKPGNPSFEVSVVDSKNPLG